VGSGGYLGMAGQGRAGGGFFIRDGRSSWHGRAPASLFSRFRPRHQITANRTGLDHRGRPAEGTRRPFIARGAAGGPANAWARTKPVGVEGSPGTARRDQDHPRRTWSTAWWPGMWEGGNGSDRLVDVIARLALRAVDLLHGARLCRTRKPPRLNQAPGTSEEAHPGQTALPPSWPAGVFSARLGPRARRSCL